MHNCRWVGLIMMVMVGLADRAGAGPVDASEPLAERGVSVISNKDRVVVGWPIEGGETGRLTISLRPDGPLIEGLGFGTSAGKPAVDLLKGLDLSTTVTVGSREGERDRPPGMSPFNVFFDNPAKRPHTTHKAHITHRRLKASIQPERATIAIGDVAMGPFTGEILVTVYAGSRLVHFETVVSTTEKDRAFTYDTGLTTRGAGLSRLAWTDTERRLHRESIGDTGERPRAIKVRHRAIVAETDHGSVACFPPPHQYFFPRDLTDNLGFTWASKSADGSGFGIRQDEAGGGNFVPWFNAPPGTKQHLGVFYLLTRGRAEEALTETLKYTHGDRFPEMAGYKTFTSHWHMATAIAAMKEIAKGGDRSTPDLVRMFHDMGVNIVHLAEFHGDGHPQDPGPIRLTELKAMFDECRRLSDGSLLMLPGEEANVHLGSRRGGNGGHWLYLFPKPVYWTMRRGKDEPFVEEKPGVGKVYHVGNRDEMARLIELEHGLAWTAHARIKASTWAPDIYKDEDFYRSKTWLGAAWKAMPADLSRDRLGERTLDLLDDMNNRGDQKQLIGEVDVFKIDHTHELYGAMNVNYVRLDRVPTFDDDWSPVLKALRDGRFFVTTGEVLLQDVTIGGKSSGETLKLGENGRAEVRIDLNWTFPMEFAEVVSGDGTKVYRHRIDLRDTEAFGRRTVTATLDLKGRRWARVEAWDVACDGVFSEPVGIEAGPR